MATSLNDVLSEEPAETPVEKPAAEPAAKEAPAPGPEASEKPPAQQDSRKAHQAKEMDARGFERDPETGQFLPKKTEAEKPETKDEKPAAETKPAEPPKVEPPQQQFTEKERALLAAAHDERRKRQEAEAKLKALEEKTPAEPAQDFWQDPDGWLKSQQAALKAEAARSQVSTTLKVSEMLARSRYQDFDAAIAVFAELAGQTPGIGEQMLASADPAEFAYRTGKNHKELREAGSLDALKARIEKEARIKIEAEFKEQAEKRAAERAALPPSLSDARGTLVNKPVWNGPTPLDDILK